MLGTEVDTGSLNTSFYLSQDEMAEMAEYGMELKAHTMSHPSL